MEELTVVTEKMVFGGDCLARAGGKNIFIPFALPHEKLRVRLVQSKKDYARAEIVEILEASPHRTQPVCPLYQKCGGCNLMHCANDEQRRLKAKILRDCFLRAGLSLDQIPEISTIYDRDLSYRARFQLTDGGLLERNSNTVVPIEHCPVAENGINAWLLQNPPERRAKGRLHIFASAYAERIVIEESCPKRKNNAQHNNLANKNFKKPKNRFSGTIEASEQIATVRFGETAVSFDVRGFFQSNMFVLEKALPEICNFTQAQKILDLYSGCALFSVLAAKYSAQLSHITLVEHNRDAVVFAEKNLAAVNLPHESYGISGAKWAQMTTQCDFDGVIIDPPRSGLEKEVREFLKAHRIPQINAVSCQPATHARDLAELVQSGYKMQKLFLLDFYPQTSHIESLAILTTEK